MSSQETEKVFETSDAVVQKHHSKRFSQGQPIAKSEKGYKSPEVVLHQEAKTEGPTMPYRDATGSQGSGQQSSSGSNNNPKGPSSSKPSSSYSKNVIKQSNKGVRDKPSSGESNTKKHR